jgi:hypothetical protein
MILAVNPKNKTLRNNDLKEVFSQGELMLFLAKNPSSEVLLDIDLPGNLKVETLVQVIRKRFPEAQVSIIENSDVERSFLPVLYQPTAENEILSSRTWVPYLAAAIIWLLVLGVLTMGLPQQQVWITYAVISAVVGAIVFGCISLVLTRRGSSLKKQP